MAEQQFDNTNRCVLFSNTKKTPGSKQPDYRGKLDVGGEEFELAGWIRIAKNSGKKFLALTVKPAEQRDDRDDLDRSFPR